MKEKIIAIDESGNLWAWGENSHGQLGDGTTKNKYIPVQIKPATKFKTISAGFSHSMAIDEMGNLWAWGNDEYGKPGNGTLIAIQFYIPPLFWLL